MKDLKIAFFGTPRFAQIVLEKLIRSPFKPDLVITAPDSYVGRGQKTVATPVKQTAEKYGIKTFQPKNLNDPEVLRQLSTVNCQLSILVAYGKIIPKEILQIPKYGFLNIHPSLLPKYRGPSPVQSALLNREEKTGISIMLLDEKIDHGPIFSQQEIKIGHDDNNETLHEKLGEIGAKLLIKTLPQYLNGSLKSQPQNHAKATSTKHIEKKDGYINLESPPDPLTVDRMIRAYYPWPGVWTELRIKNHELRIKFLPDGNIQPEGKRPLSVNEFKNGYPKAYEQISHLLENKAQS